MTAHFHTTQIVGFRFYKGAKATMETLVHGEPLTLMRQPSNPHDSNAIAIYYAGNQLGHIPRTDAARMAVLMDAGTEMECTLNGQAPHIRVTWSGDPLPPPAEQKELF